MKNPILDTYTTPLGTIPFSDIHNSHFLPAIKLGIQRGKYEIAQITSNPVPPTFANTIVALERAGADLDKTLNIFYPLLSANTNDELMKISLEASPLLSEYSTSISLDRALWSRIRHVYESTDMAELTAEDAMLLKETYDGFARSGALLEGADREAYRELSGRLSELTTLFGQNVLKEINRIEIWLGKPDLAGLPSYLTEEASNAATDKGRPGEYLFTLAQPTYIAFMKYSTRRDLREKMYRLYSGRNIKGEYSNMEIIKEMVSLRHRMARLLGYDNYAQFVLEHRMASAVDNVYGLLDSLCEAYRPAADREMKELVDFASELEGYPLELMPWDYSYYFNKLREHKFSFNEENLRPYFKLENVIDGVFGLATSLYGLSFKQRDDIQVYHTDVKVFQVNDEDGAYLGLLYTDFFPRESKRPGAWMTEFKAQWNNETDGNSRPMVSIVMNFTKPTASKPSLLTPGEVGTLLHEFGHALHGLLSQTHYASLSGTNVRRDFVELPSQFNENYLTEKESLNKFACHYVTGEPIPDELLDQMLDSSRFGAAYSCMRQLCFGFLDMAWHTVQEPVDDVATFEDKAINKVAMFEPVDGALISPQFSHIFAGGYAAGYYSYKWAEVLDADAFELFRNNGLFDRETARSFRHNILERGGTENPEVLYERFRGQKPTIDALLRRDGIK